MPGPQITPVGDLYAPFWSLQFYPSKAASLARKGPPVTRRDSQTGEALELAADDIYGVSAKSDTEGGLLTITGGDSSASVGFGGGLTLRDLEHFKGDMTIKQTSSATALFDLTLKPPYEIGLEILDNRVLSRSVVIVAEWGYVDAAGQVSQSSGPYLFLGNKPGISFSSSSVSIQISGHDLLSSVLGKTTRRRKWNRRELTDREIVRALTSELGYELNEDGLALDSEAFISFGLRNKEPVELEQNSSDWIFLKKLVSENKASLFVGPGEANGPAVSKSKPMVYLFSTANVWQTSDRRYTLRSHEQLQSEYDIPIISFDSQLDGRVFLTAGAASLDVRQDNLRTGATRQQTADVTKDHTYGTPKGQTAAGAIAEATRVQTTVGVVKTDLETPEKGSLLISVPSRDSNALNRAKVEGYKQAEYANSKAQCEIPGMATIHPWQVVNVSGMGRSLSGAYTVVSVEHRLGSDGYKTSLSLIRGVITQEQTPGTTQVVGPKTSDDASRESDTEEPESLEDEER